MRTAEVACPSCGAQVGEKCCNSGVREVAAPAAREKE
jgi:hypothetical protein